VPAACVSGDGTKISLPIQVSNLGNVPLAAEQRMDVAIYARPVGSEGDQDVPVRTLTGQLIGGLSAGETKTIAAAVLLPAGLEAGQYVLAVQVDSSGQIEESDETNNVAATEQSIDVTRGYVDLAGVFGTVILPRDVVSDAKITGKAQVIVSNAGNVPLAVDQKVDVILTARSLADDSEIELGAALSQLVGKLTAAKPKPSRPTSRRWGTCPRKTRTTTW